MSLDGLRAWIGEVERKLGMRTKVMLALAAIAIGGAAVGIYLAIDTRDNAVSEKDVQELQTELESQIGAAGGGASLTGLEAEVNALRAEVEELQAGGKKGGKGGASGSEKSKESGGAGGGGGAGAVPELAP